MVTLGRASKFAPITPTGTRRSVSRSPPGSSRTGWLSGGNAASASSPSCRAMSCSRDGSRRSRSSSPRPSPACSPSAMSAALAARISPARSVSSAAIPRSAASMTASGAPASWPAAAAAASPQAITAFCASATKRAYYFCLLSQDQWKPTTERSIDRR